MLEASNFIEGLGDCGVLEAIDNGCQDASCSDYPVAAKPSLAGRCCGFILILTAPRTFGEPAIQFVSPIRPRFFHGIFCMERWVRAWCFHGSSGE